MQDPGISRAWPCRRLSINRPVTQENLVDLYLKRHYMRWQKTLHSIHSLFTSLASRVCWQQSQQPMWPTQHLVLYYQCQIFACWRFSTAWAVNTQAKKLGSPVLTQPTRFKNARSPILTRGLDYISHLVQTMNELFLARRALSLPGYHPTWQRCQ